MLFETSDHDYNGTYSPRTLNRYNGSSDIVFIPEGIQNIDHHAFLNHTEIRELFIPLSLKRMCEDAFEGCDHLMMIHSPLHSVSVLETARILAAGNRQNGTQKNFVDGEFVPPEEKTYGEEDLPPWKKMDEEDDLTSWEIMDDEDDLVPDEFQDSALSDCLIYYGTYFESPYCFINYALFSKKEFLEELWFTNEQQSLTGCRYDKYIYLRKAVLPSTLVEIGDNTFNNCTMLREISFPLSVVVIGRYSFRHCDSLSSVTFPHTLKHIGEGAFAMCPSLERVEFLPPAAAGGDDTYCIIGADAFRGCRSLKSFIQPQGMRVVPLRCLSGIYTKELAAQLAEHLEAYSTREVRKQKSTRKICVPWQVF